VRSSYSRIAIAVLLVLVVFAVASHSPEALAALFGFPVHGAGATAFAMSWSIGYANRRDFQEDRREYSSGVSDAEHVDDQVRVARAVVTQIIESGAVGRDTNVPGGHKDFTVTLSGHGNAGHEPAQGWANDCLSIHITQKSDAANLGGTSRAEIADRKRAVAALHQHDIIPGPVSDGAQADGSGLASEDDGMFDGTSQGGLTADEDGYVGPGA
jgi:hypothetical protein